MMKQCAATIVIFFTAFISLSHAQDTAPKTGSFVIKSTMLDVMGEETANAYAAVLDATEEIEWEVFVPESYDPAKPAGVMVYVSPQNSINVPSGWMNVMEEQNLIWIAARLSGNKINPARRITFAVMGPPLIQTLYQIDVNRIYVSGLSGGGRIASMVASDYPSIFNGAVYNCGVNFWEQTTPEKLELIKQNRFVFITGSDDFNLDDTKRVYSKYKKAGVENIKLTVIRNMGHENPKASRFRKAIAFLDSPKN